MAPRRRKPRPTYAEISTCLTRLRVAEDSAIVLTRRLVTSIGSEVTKHADDMEAAQHSMRVCGKAGIVQAMDLLSRLMEDTVK